MREILNRLEGNSESVGNNIDEEVSGIEKLIKDGYAFTPDEILEYCQSNNVKGKKVGEEGNRIVVEYTIYGQKWKIIAPEEMQVLESRSLKAIIGNIEEINFGPREFVGPRPDSSVYTKKVADEIIKDAQRVIGKGSMVDSARVSLDSAIKLYKKKDYEYAILKALKSIQYSVGILSSLYAKYKKFDNSVIVK